MEICFQLYYQNCQELWNPYNRWDFNIGSAELASRATSDFQFGMGGGWCCCWKYEMGVWGGNGASSWWELCVEWIHGLEKVKDLMQMFWWSKRGVSAWACVEDGWRWCLEERGLLLGLEVKGENGVCEDLETVDGGGVFEMYVNRTGCLLLSLTRALQPFIAHRPLLLFLCEWNYSTAHGTKISTSIENICVIVNIIVDIIHI